MWQGTEFMGGWGFMFLGPLFAILIFALFIYLIFALVRKLAGDGPSAAPRDKSGLDILQERFALGEIDADEFERRRAVLQETAK